MQLFTLLSLILACIVAAAAIPLQLVDLNNHPTTFGPVLEEALRDANAQIQLMLTTINDANHDEAAMGRITMAFGPKPPMAKIKKNILDLQTKAMRVLESEDETLLAETRWTILGDPSSAQTEFGKKDFNLEPPAHRAFLVLHEAAHNLWQAADDYEDTGSATRVIPMGYTGEYDKKHLKVEGGYALNPGYQTPFNVVDLRPLFIRVRDTAPNMDMNADSYALLGMLCSQRWSPGGTNHPSGSGGLGTLARPVTPTQPSASGGATTSARPVTPSGSGGSQPGSPTTSTRPVAPNPASGKRKPEPNPAGPNPASDSDQPATKRRRVE